DPVRIRHDASVVQEHVDVVLGRQQGADVSLQHEVRLPGALDGFGYVLVDAMNQFANLATDRLLPIGQRFDVGINPRVGDVGHGGSAFALTDSSSRGFDDLESVAVFVAEGEHGRDTRPAQQLVDV